MNLLGSSRNTLSILLVILIMSGLSVKEVRGSTDITTISVSPLLTFASVGEHFNINLTIMDAVDVYAWQVNMTFDPTVVSVVTATLPPDHFLEGQPAGTTGLSSVFRENSVLLGCATLGDYLGVNGSGILVTIEFEVVAIGKSILEIDDSEPFRTQLLDSQLRQTLPGPNLKIEHGFIISDPNWIELFDLYEQLLANYSSLLASYHSLNSSYYSHLDDYQDLLSSYDNLESDYMFLNTTYVSLLGDHTQMQADYDSLQSEFDSLSDSYSSLEALYQLLNSTYSSLKADYDDLKSKYETSTYELGSARSLSYILIVSTIAFIVTTAYFAIRKPKVKTT